MTTQLCSYFADAATLTPETIRQHIDPENSECPFHRFKGDETMLRRVLKPFMRLAYMALGNVHHLCNQYSIAEVGPPGCGKTDVARAFGELLHLPFIEINSSAISSMNEILVEVSQVLMNFSDGELKKGVLELLLLEGKHDFCLPSCIMFFDEVHALPKKIFDGLLKTIDANNRVMQTEYYSVDCRNVCFIVATTKRGKLPRDFDSRFVKVDFDYYSEEQMAKIVQWHNKDWSEVVCRLVSKYGGMVPREVLDFAKIMRSEYKMMYEGKHFSNEEIEMYRWSEVAKTVAQDQGIDEFGMSERRLRILTALSRGPVASARLATITNCEQEEIESYHMPPLLSAARGKPLVVVSNRGYELTDAGKRELDKRNLPYGELK